MNRTTLLNPILAVILVVIAGIVSYHLWNYYMNDPWTRDARVRADVIQIAPDVSGFITELSVADNDPVKAGAPLFVIDRERYKLALESAQAVAESKRAAMQQAQSDAARYGRASRESVPAINRDQANARAAMAAAEYKLAQAEVKTAQLNLDRTVVKAPLDGVITNSDIRIGLYKTAGNPVFALVADGSYYVMGYFEETKLRHIQIGDPVDIHLMGVPEAITGHVDSISSGIVDRERGESPNMLANVNPTFSWVRLAQRIPVRIELDRVPKNVKLIAGQTATVRVRKGQHS
jgi:multidrug resistance efflux pump